MRMKGHFRKLFDKLPACRSLGWHTNGVTAMPSTSWQLVEPQPQLATKAAQFSFLFRNLCLVALLFVFAYPVWAQRATGAITGRVVTEDGQPVRHASVAISGMGGVRRTISGRLAIITDDDGNFQADGLDPMPYQIGVSAPGYVMLPAGKNVDPTAPRPVTYAYVGESVTLTMVRGGVITGRIVNAGGEPVIGVAVKVERVRDESGRPTKEQSLFYIAPRQTDDRGIYRIYGLMPGSYLVSIGGGGRGYSSRTTPYENRLPVYYPSATRDTAMEVTVRSGEESTGIDIRYRAERGFAVSGKVLGGPADSRSGMVISTSSILLRNPVTGNIVSSTFIAPMGDQNNGYALYGIPNGEYEAIASRSPQGDEASLESAPRRFTVNGNDVTGIDLTMAPLASLAGTVTIENAPTTGEHKCEAKREFYLNETLVNSRRDEPNEKEELAGSLFGLPQFGVPDDKGEFSIRGLKAGRYRLLSQMPDENWFLKSVKAKATGAAPPNDAGRNGLTLKAGERLAGVTVTIASGAAGLKGKITTAAGVKLPSRLRVYLLPAEPEAKDELLRFAEVKAEENGSFSFANLAPGKYLLTTRAIPDTEPADKPAKPAAWDLMERAKLRKEAEAAHALVELKACQRVTDFALRFGK